MLEGLNFLKTSDGPQQAFVGIDLGREPVPDETTPCKLCKSFAH